MGKSKSDLKTDLDMERKKKEVFEFAAFVKAVGEQLSKRADELREELERGRGNTQLS